MSLFEVILRISVNTKCLAKVWSTQGECSGSDHDYQTCEPGVHFNWPTGEEETLVAGWSSQATLNLKELLEPVQALDEVE